MHCVLLVTVLISAVFAAPPQDDKPTDPCQPTCKDGITLDLHSLGEKTFVTQYKDNNYTYSPCKTLDQDGCKEAVVCQVSPNSSLPLGIPDTVQVSCDDKSLNLTFTADKRSSVIILECSENPKFELLTKEKNIYSFILGNPYICSAFKNATTETTTESTTQPTTDASITTTSQNKTDSTTNTDTTTTHHDNTTTESSNSTVTQNINSTTTSGTTASAPNTTTSSNNSTILTGTPAANSSTVDTTTTNSNYTTSPPHTTTHGSAVSFQICSSLLLGAMAVIQLF